MRISDLSSDVCSSDLLAVQRLDDAVLHVGRHALVEPLVLGRGEGHQVARPAVREFMRDQRHQRLVADDHRGGDERQAQIGRATSELQSLMRISYAVFCLKKKKTKKDT